jgi:class 3 adenylate cyclase
MDLSIEHARTSDGVIIAHASFGNGVPLVKIPPALPWSNVEQEWQIPEWRHYYEHLAETFRVIRYDNRGAGLSSRDVERIDLQTHIQDLEAVVNKLGLERFVLSGLYFNSVIAVAYAAKHPERVAALILWIPVLHPEESTRPLAEQEALDRLMDIDYGIFTETLAHTIFGWDEGEAAHRMAQYMQSSMSAEVFKTCWKHENDFDVRPLLGDIAAPALVVHRRDYLGTNLEVSRRVVAAMPNARLAILPGSSLSPYMGDVGAAVALFNEFVGVDRDRAEAQRSLHAHDKTGPETPVAFRTIMFTDMQESTAITQRLGDSRAQELVRQHNQIVEQALGRYGGTRVKHTGDGIMASFPTATGAVECAVEIQRAFDTRNGADPETLVQVRIGINAGEPVAEGDDLFGTSVQMAARVCASAEVGEILTTDVVRQLVAGKGFLFFDKGAAELRGFEDPVRVFEVRWRTDT